MISGTNKTFNISLRIVDTPGLFDIDIPFAKRALEIQRSVAICSGPHAFLIVISPENDMTVYDTFTDTIGMMRLMFGDCVFDSTIIVFSHGQNFVCDKDFYRFWTEKTELAQLVSQCGHRIVRVENVEESEDQEDNIMKKVNEMSLNGIAEYRFPSIEIHSKALQDHLDNYNGGSCVRTQILEVERKLDTNKNVIALNKMRNETKIILIGKSGNGKSSTGNTLLGGRAFVADRDLNAVTEKCEMKTGNFMTHKLSVVDTPGLFDTAKSLAERALEIQKAVTICPGPHAFLLVFSGANRMTEEEKFTIDLMRVIFGEKVFDNTIIVFTRGSEFSSDADFTEFWEKNVVIKKLVEQCNGRILKIENINGNRDEACWDILNAIQSPHVYKYQYLNIHKNALEKHLKNYNGKRDIHKELEDVVGRLASELNKDIWKVGLVAGGTLLVTGAVVSTVGIPAAVGMIGTEVGAYDVVAGIAGVAGVAGGIYRVAGVAQAAWGSIKGWVRYKTD
ncbi:GTPase IMAP family member 8-like [Mercenaria mercenaria]|uniref:GTPase IMAP family member 8-like n=1 Tax=Mercenaria mercenaria TaxID=6596 RepID=UPI00234E816F|nr:GTPase IMAP family member 8-like [Mercenaria mercenaria]